MTNNKAFSLITGLVITVGSLGWIPWISPLRTSQEVAYKLAAILFISLFLIKNTWLKLFLAYCTVMVFLRTTPQTIIVLQTLVSLSVMFQVLADHLNKERIKILLDIICIIGVLQSVMMILQYFGIWFGYFPIYGTPAIEWFKGTPFAIELYAPIDIVKSMRGNIAGFTSNPNMASGLLALCIPAFLRRSRLILLPILLSALWINNGLQGILTVMILCSIYISSKLSKRDVLIFLGVAVAVIAAYLFYTGEWKAFVRYDRLPIWKVCIKNIIPLHPIVGSGLGLGQRVYPLIQKLCHVTEAFTHPHNEFIFLFMETGLVGFSLMMGFIATSLYKFYRSMDKIKLLVLLGIISGLLNCMASFTVHVTIGIIWLVYLSIMQYENQTEVAR